MEFELLVSDVAGWVPTVAQMVRKSATSGNKPVLGWNQKDGILFGLRIYGSFKTVVAINGLSAPAPVPDGMFQGTATLTTNPGTPTADEWWTATEVGVYTNFGGVEVTTMTDVFNYLKWTQATTSWSVVTVDIPGVDLIQRQADWNQGNNLAKDYIKNKPTIPAAQVNSDWDSVAGVSEILNRPDTKLAEFTDNSDVPASYAGHAGKTVRVNDAGTGLTFDDVLTQAISQSISL